MRANETWTLLHGKGNHKQDEKTTLRMGENIYKLSNWPRINLQNSPSFDKAWCMCKRVGNFLPAFHAVAHKFWYIYFHFIFKKISKFALYFPFNRSFFTYWRKGLFISEMLFMLDFFHCAVSVTLILWELLRCVFCVWSNIREVLTVP